MRKLTLILMVAIAAVAIAILVLPVTHVDQHHLVLKAYFDDVHGLRSGADVRLAGVSVGKVRSVEARPELKDRPAEVVMDLWTPNELRVPKDAIVSVVRGGLLGDELITIDVSGTIGETARSGDALRTHPTQLLTTEQIVNGIKEAVQGTAEPAQAAKKAEKH